MEEKERSNRAKSTADALEEIQERVSAHVLREWL